MTTKAEKIIEILKTASSGLRGQHASRLDIAILVEQAVAEVLALQQHGEPEGWKLVPVEPTLEQLEAMPSLPAIKLPMPENLKHLRPHQYQNRERYLAALSASPLPPAPGAETGEKRLKIDRDWCIEAAKREEAAGDPDCSVGTFLVPPSPEQEEYLDKVKALGAEYDRSTIISSSRQAVLEKALREISALRSTCNVFGAGRGSYDTGHNNAIFAAAKIAEAALATTPPAEGETK